LVELSEKSGFAAVGPPLAAEDRARLEKELSAARDKLREVVGEKRDRRKKERVEERKAGRKRVSSGEGDAGAAKKAEPGDPANEKDKQGAKRPLRENPIALRARVAGLENRLASYDAEGKPKLFCMGVEDLAKPRNSALLARGEISKAGEVVPRGFVGVIFDGQAPVVRTGTSGRLELANWITAPENPLAARVLVNRVWHWLFGLGIVASVDNFGSTGQKPSNQELLDFLALRFQEQGWSIKKLIREIVLSRTYALASTFNDKNFHADPDNALLWRHSKRRLDAESIRDAILSASGTLELKPSLGSPVAAGGDGPVARRRAARGNFDGESNARSVYLPIVRDMVPEVLDLFDFAEPSLVTGARESTNVPAQALFLLNSPFVARQARLCAERLQRLAPEPRERLDLAFRLIVSRPPTEAERRAAQAFFDDYAKATAEDGKRQSNEAKRASRKAPFRRLDRKDAARQSDTEAPGPWTAFCRSLLASAEFRCLD